MNSTIKKVCIAVTAVIAIFIAYRLLFIRTVNYNIGGIDIPARYNVLTGKATPIDNYIGKTPKKTVTDRRTDKMGLDSQDVTAAQFRWALFEEWARSQPRYKGWENDPELFKKANEEFKKKVPSNVQVLK